MRFTLAATLAFAVSSVSASIIARQSIPACADNCLFGSNVDYDGCSETDDVCLCKSQVFVSTSTSCIEAACSGSDLQTALQVSQEICAAVGVTLTSTYAAASTGASSSTAAASAAKSTVTSPASSGSSAASSTTSSAAAAATTNAAVSNSINALAGLAAIGLAAMAL
ncbi:hypothetical protein H0H92_005137 [Tricholoma furcatifolium]|nr:hypothetical protein H0H92_005137 [Tricholoma furcatifolium]